MKVSYIEDKSHIDAHLSEDSLYKCSQGFR
jgi:hypothetical protein